MEKITEGLYILNGNEPLGFLGKKGAVTAKVRGRWYLSYTVAVNHRKRASDEIVEGVYLSSPLSARQLARMRVYRDSGRWNWL